MLHSSDKDLNFRKQKFRRHAENESAMQPSKNLRPVSALPQNSEYNLIKGLFSAAGYYYRM